MDTMTTNHDDTGARPPFSFDESPPVDYGLPGDPYAPPQAPPAWPAAPAPVEPKPENPRRGVIGVALLATVCALFGSGVGVLAGRELADDPAATTTTLGGGNGAAPVRAAEPKSFVAVAEKVLPSVVSISIGGGGGSGVVIRPDGYILTNNHVVENAPALRVTFNDGTTANARVVGADAASDLAVIKVDRTGLPAATLGSSANVRVGDQVLAVGSPLGLSGTVTAGIVSALNRPVNTTARTFGGSAGVTTVIDAIQTDAPINPGNSGGALVDLNGQVIGVNTAIASTTGGSVGVGFAIPIDQAKVIAQQLIDTGRARRAQLGVSIATATTTTGETRAVLQSVIPGGPAAEAGLRAGDVILKVGGKQVGDADSLIAAIRSHQPGEMVEVEYERNGSRDTVRVRLTDAATG
ncbi:MAG TPA: trypsin-like peptidase domain-containing protein [Frankiaceae bacterium]|nr:trypsin-like peptidase domain-containing protein [Frankiaceae bacterium]